MPCARDCIRQILGKWESKECLSLDAVVSSENAHQNLYAPENHHHIEILQGRPLRRSWLESEEGVLFGIRPVNELLFLRRIPPDQSADSSQQSNEAQHAPQHSTGSRHIADQRFMRPVVRVCRVRAETIRAASPRSPPEERGELTLLCSVGQCTAGDGICRPAASKNVGVICAKLVKRRGAISA